LLVSQSSPANRKNHPGEQEEKEKSETEPKEQHVKINTPMYALAIDHATICERSTSHTLTM
jgi:hypothetical protein